MPLFSLDTHGQLDPHRSQEWLLTNGLGGFASSTVLGCNTRRYHGLLCAATLPPVGRIMTVNRINEIIYLDGDDKKIHELGITQCRDCFHPRGEQYLRHFKLDDTATWEFDVDGVSVVKELQLVWMKNIAAVRYRVDPGPKRHVKLALLPFIGLRDFHSERHADGSHFDVEIFARGVDVRNAGNPLAARIVADAGAFQKMDGWWYGNFYAVEADRGLDCFEDLFSPGRFVIEGDGPFSITLWISLDAIEPLDWDGQLAQRRGAIIAAASSPPPGGSLDQRRLIRAANDFIVARKAPNGSEGTTVVAGYPWFADWGRDTMISLPGLLLATGRFKQAQQVLTVFAQYVSEGMIPNRFDDYTNEPHYNTVDASLWFIHAAFEYLRLSHDGPTFEQKLLPACQAILSGYQKGTRFNIAMDPNDGLITQGDAKTQLTWMDAKQGDTAFTPRQGKAVEINALWYHALMLLHQTELAGRVRESFCKAFWISPFRGLSDVSNGDWRDNSIRPNQIFAVSLPNSPLTNAQQSAVVEIVRRELLTPMGLRTLSSSDQNYKGRYGGSPWDRDSAYHNGTVWPWLIGPFLSAYLRVNKSSDESIEQAKKWLYPLIDQMQVGSIGQIPEICEGSPPHAPRGCPAQAWSVAEVLRLAIQLGI
jgi:predicted glycogen debranching enzyme